MAPPLPRPDGRLELIVFLAVIGTAIASMPVYALRGRRRDADQEGKGGQLFGGAGDFLLHWFMWAIDPLLRLSLALKLTPDVYNFVGLALGVVSGVFIARGELALGGWAIALGGVADILDGRIARLTGVASAYGDFIDSTFDRFVEVFAFLGFVVFFRDNAYGVFLSAAAMAGSLIVSYARARGEVHGVNCSGGLMQRGERLVLTCLVCLVDPSLSAWLGRPLGTAALWVMGLMAVTTFITATHRTIWIGLRLRGAAARNVQSPEK
jgi:CDP-diacylglycerol--glycerol-3-phosphate 3-phosphatidyltransferase